jgi:hypothetical protein
LTPENRAASSLSLKLYLKNFGTSDIVHFSFFCLLDFFFPDTSLLEALGQLRAEGESVGIVLQGDKSAEILFLDRIL